MHNHHFVERAFDCDSQQDFCGVEGPRRFVRCNFNDVRIRPAKPLGEGASVTDFPTFGNAVFEDCVVTSLFTNQTLFHDIEVRGTLRTGGEILWGCAFQRVTLRGKVEALLLHSIPNNRNETTELQRSTRQMLARFYETSDWALDISECSFKAFRATGIPPHVLRLNPATQGVVRRERLRRMDWRKHLDPNATAMGILFRVLEASDDEHFVFAAQTWGKKRDCQASVDELKRLRDLGIVDSA